MGVAPVAPNPSHLGTSAMAALPDFMVGDFQMETSEGFNDFMYEMGVNFVTRNIANNLYPLQQIRQDKDDEMITLETLTSFKNTKIEFKLGVEFEEYTADGRSARRQPVWRTESWSRSRFLTPAPATTPPGRSGSGPRTGT